MGDVATRQRGAEHVPARLSDVMLLIERDMRTIEQWLSHALQRDSSCAVAASDLIRAGGKRLRPALVLLGARVVSPGGIPFDRAHRLGAAVEMLHAATLLHDDVIDDAVLRRGLPSARVVWGNPVSVIAGDLLLVQALEWIGSLENTPLDRMTTRTLRELVLGEVEQLERRGSLDMDVDTFERIATRKTASLFVMASVGGAMLAGADEHRLETLRSFATAAGLAFQLDDDLLDLCASAETLGKAIGQDLATGAVTLPVADVLAADPGMRAALAEHLQAGERARLPTWMGRRVLEVAARAGTLDRSRSLVAVYARRAANALERLPDCVERRALHKLVELLIWRSLGQHQHGEAAQSA
jgi:geranylgeranyl pyrophosphate synthase